eukprot:scaffold10131_cov82-Skeletonema_dohrnii-CCMP3373.AAC.2
MDEHHKPCIAGFGDSNCCRYVKKSSDNNKESDAYHRSDRFNQNPSCMYVAGRSCTTKSKENEEKEETFVLQYLQYLCFACLPGFWGNLDRCRAGIISSGQMLNGEWEVGLFPLTNADYFVDFIVA